MAEKTVLISQQLLKPIKILKWKVSVGNSMSIGSVILLYDFDGATTPEQRKLKSTQAGTVHELIAPEGAIIKPGSPLLKLQACIHPTVMKDMCAECGADLRREETLTSASVPMVHSIPDLKVSEELAQKLGKADGERLLRDRKLVLLVDLDQTLIHTTNDNIPVNIKDVYHFQLYGPNSPWYHTRLRPGTHKFLNNVSPMFELHICTFGARNYAHMITMFLDGDQRYFSNRILSRDECFDPTSKKANLKALFPCGDNMVCIIDDREDVWNHASNLIHVKPYHFFQHTGDINAPPGLDKLENDEKEGVDLSKLKKKLLKPNGKNVGGETNGVEEIKTNGENISADKRDNINKEDEPDKNEENKESVDKLERSSVLNKEDVSGETEEKAIVNEESVNAKTVDKVGSVVGKTILNKKGFPGDNEEKAVENQESVDAKTLDKVENVVGTSVEHEESVTNAEKEESVVDKTTEKGENVDEKNEEIVDGITLETEECADRKTEEKMVDVELEIKNVNTVNTKPEEKMDVEEINMHVKESVDDELEKNSENAVNSQPKEKMEVEEIDTHVKEQNNPKEKNGKLNKEDDLIEIEDPDDYLLHLEDILKCIHKTFYEEYDKLESGDVPDLKRVIPNVRSKILNGTKLVFSGLVPTHIKLQQSKAYQVARSLGAVVTQDLDGETTHLVAVRPGTAKVNAGRRRKNLKIVTPDWLWSCAERWEHVAEAIYPLSSKGSKNRHPPPHCSSPEHVANYPVHDAPGARKRTPSGRFMDTINPLMSFSSDDIADMDKEVEDILDDESDESEEESQKKVQEAPPVKIPIIQEEESSSSSDESLTGEFPRGFKRTREKRKLESMNNDEDDQMESSLDEFPSTKFRRGEQLDSDLDIGQESNSEGSVEAPDEVDDGEWNMMGAALEREFLSNN